MQQRRACEPLVAASSAAARSSRCGSASRRGRNGSGAPASRTSFRCRSLRAAARSSCVGVTQASTARDAEIDSPSASRTAVARPSGDEDPLDVRLGPQLAACVANDRGQTVRRASCRRRFGTGIPPSWSAQAITCVMKPDTAWSGPSPVCNTHGASRPRVRSSSNVSVSQSRADSSVCPANSTRPRRP